METNQDFYKDYKHFGPLSQASSPAVVPYLQPAHCYAARTFGRGKSPHLSGIKPLLVVDWRAVNVLGVVISIL